MIWEPMLAHRYIEKNKYIKFPCYVQPKLDGMRCCNTVDGFYSRGGKKIKSVPGLEKSVQDKFIDWKLDGELYSHSMTFQEMMSDCRKTVNIMENNLISYYVFDFMDENTVFEDRLLMLRQKQFELPPRCHLLETYSCNNESEFYSFFKSFLNAGYEGIIYRSINGMYAPGKRSVDLLKLKTTHCIEATCVDIKIGKGRHEKRMGAIECALKDYVTVFVGSGFSDSDREDIWNNKDAYIGRKVKIQYQEKTDRDVPRFPVFIMWI